MAKQLRVHKALSSSILINVSRQTAIVSSLITVNSIYCPQSPFQCARYVPQHDWTTCKAQLCSLCLSLVTSLNHRRFVEFEHHQGLQGIQNSCHVRSWISMNIRFLYQIFKSPYRSISQGCFSWLELLRGKQTSNNAVLIMSICFFLYPSEVPYVISIYCWPLLRSKNIPTMINIDLREAKRRTMFCRLKRSPRILVIFRSRNITTVVSDDN